MKKNQQQDIDISDFIHTVELIINNFPISKATYEFYKNHDNISFDIVRVKEYTHLKIHIEDIKKLNIRSFDALRTYIYDFIGKINNKNDRYKLWSAFNADQIKIFRLDVFNRIYYDQDKDFFNLFNHIRNKYILFDILLPRLGNCNNSNDNSLYLNMTNNKVFIIYDEIEKRNLPSIKLEMRFSHSDNIKRILKLDESSAETLSIRKVASLSIPELKRSYNKYIDSFNNSMILKKYRKSLEKSKAEIIDIMNTFSTNISEVEDINIDSLFDIYQNIITDRKDVKKYLLEKRKHKKTSVLLNYHSIDNKIKDIIKKKHGELYKKLYPEEFEEITEDNFFRVQIPSYSFVLSFFDFDNTKRYKWITSSLKSDLRKLRKEHSPFHKLSYDDKELLKEITLNKMTPAIKKIEEKYRYNSKNKKVIIDAGLHLLIKAPETISDDKFKDKFKELVRVYLSHSPEYVRLIKDFQYFFNRFKFCIDHTHKHEQ